MKHYERGSLFGPAMDSEAESIVAAAQAGGIARVALDSGADRLFDYAVGRELSGAARPGCRVRVPVGRANRLQVGFVVERPTEAAVERLKRVVEVLDEEELLDEAMLRLARWVSEYYCSPLGQVLAAMVPGAVKKQVGMQLSKMWFHILLQK